NMEDRNYYLHFRNIVLILSCFSFCSLDILHIVVCKEEEEQERSPSQLQEEPEPPHIKEEHEETLQHPEEPGGSTLTSLAVKSETDEDISS
ncbi:hypothetical protein, partial [Nocardioides malaquae]|uniref:hypothetical protein n=1 Tax=Nocardioides malaquae TaxID=2773426 RepID=UPI001D0CE8ED